MSRASQKRAGRGAFPALCAFVAAVWLAAAPPLSAQSQVPDFGLPESPVLVVDPNRLFAETAFGRRFSVELEQRRDALAAENRRIESELEAEEKALTEKRADTTAQEFRALADAFDAKVQRTRAEQENKASQLASEGENAQRRFLGAAAPVLEALMLESGAAVLLDKRSAILSADAVDVTEEAVRRIDAAIGDGSGTTPPQQPQQEPQPQQPSQD